VSDSLPILDIRSEFLAACREPHRRVLLSAPTGSGKSTQIPQFLLDAGLLGDGRIVVLQPRRLATRLLAARVAAERRSPLGGEVGYQIRLDARTSAATRIEFVTEGILLRRFLADPSLPGVSAILFDEFHERHAYGDVTLAQALLAQRAARPDLLLVVASATLDTPRLAAYLDPCAVVSSDGRLHPVDVSYLPRPLDPARTPPWQAAADAYAAAARDGLATASTLVFMPGAYEISRTVDALRDVPAARRAAILPLHGELPPDAQDAAVAPSSGPKIIVATNVAETSLTIPGVTLVIDSGLARVARYDPYRGINTLLVESISRASADQRAGRAGRTAPGHALRLWTLHENEGRAAHDVPEIRRIDPSEILLALAALGHRDPDAFPWLDAPEPAALARALSLLRDLGAFDAHNALTPVGRAMLPFPLHPRWSRLLLAAADLGAVRPAATLAALAQGRPIFVRNADRRTVELRRDTLGDAPPSDHFLAMRALAYARSRRFSPDACRRLGIHAAAARAADPLAEAFLRIARSRGLPVETAPPPDSAIAKCILSAFSDQLARRLDSGTRRCLLVHNRRGELSRDSLADGAPLFVASEVTEIQRGDGSVHVLLSQATPVDEAWLRELHPSDFATRTVAAWDSSSRRVAARRETTFRDLPLDAKPLAAPPPEDAARLLAAAVLSGECPLKNWNAAADQFTARVNLLARACPDLGIPPFDAEARELVVQQLCHGHASYKEIKDAPVLPALRDLLSPAQLALLDRLAPERVALSNGRSLRVQYADSPDPYVSARISELFGVKTLPALAAGRIPLTIRILAPSQRPVQITRDLAAFWTAHYPRIRSELSRKYPKHPWPADP